MCKPKVQITVRLDRVTESKIKQLAAWDNRTKSRMISVMLKKAVQEYESVNGEIVCEGEEEIL